MPYAMISCKSNFTYSNASVLFIHISPKKEIIICKVRNQWRLSVKNKLDSLFFARLFVSEQKQIASMTRHKKTCLREFEILVASSQQVAQK